jgi:NhaC family Na+:H+ antiporter
MAGIVAVFAQPQIIGAVAGECAPVHGHQLDFMEGVKGMYMSYYGPTAIDTGNEALNELVSTGGMTGMLNTIFLIISAVTFGGALVGSGMLQSLTEKLTQFIRRRVTMVSATVGTGIFANMITGDQYLSIILTSSLYKNLYRQKGYEPKLLSRSVEDSATVVSVLIPWNSCGMTQSTVLNVSTWTYLPYCLFNIISPVMSIIIAAIGYKIVKKSK